MRRSTRVMPLLVVLAAYLACSASPRHEAGPLLPAELAAALSEPAYDRARIGLAARFLDAEQPFAAHQDALPLTPASTVKLITTACALERLGPSHRFRTELLADRLPDADGLLSGALYVRGAGDPLLLAEDLWVALRELAALGLGRIEGPLVVDDSALAEPGWPAAWAARRAPDPYDAAQGAAAVGWNSVELIVRAGKTTGAPARIETYPWSAPKIVNRVSTARRTAVRVELREPRDGPGTLVVSGTVAARSSPYRRWVRLGHPSHVTLAALAELLPRAGISWQGSARRGRVPDGAVSLLARESPPLAEIVAAVDKFSSNFGAELLLRALAASDGVPAADTADGLARVGACLESWMVPQAGVRLVDGSGRARANRLTARALVAVLEAASRAPEWGAEMIAALARAGEDGTLQDRLERHRGRVRAKTGTLDGVASLAGYGWTESGRAFGFAIVVNRADADTAVGPAHADRLFDALIDAANRLDATPSPED
ncbi:MAG: D-alanyl-D-alanine carboxypeptidase/D-alanyl-D-alanine-endopeptidase [Acidobacteriota bacterium]|nr:MAG: D-alanyl-D-alanine carboxypeptidase/D-alanyl-D-alanine-endopeptidase [Acidobacteriota bacterium]